MAGAARRLTEIARLAVMMGVGAGRVDPVEAVVGIDRKADERRPTLCARDLLKDLSNTTLAEEQC